MDFLISPLVNLLLIFYSVLGASFPLAIVVIGMICVLSVRWDSTLYFDAVWILTLVGFLGSAAIARYLARGRLF